MKKITNFIVDKRYIILFLFLILSSISLFLSSKVKINYDIAKYLPADSEIRTGMDIMENEFEKIKSSSFNLMFKGLNDKEKIIIYEQLEKIEGISSVTYEKNDNYNKDDYTLYVINVDDCDDSVLASNVFNKIKEEYKDYEIYTSGDIANKNETVLPTWIVVLAVSCALVILIIMCESYIEPFLFLATILIAVLLNNGTNIIFDNVSNITSSISAILQMALSMDYSIMLMNRYNQEKKLEKDKVKAMKNALCKAFSSISSSSFTTIVGLITLVFMSFTIGRDLGFVLAKGVLFSLISIFTCLPALILMFDKLIIKTRKKSLNIKLNRLGKISYKIRYISIFLFLGAFLFNYLTKGNLNILYTSSETDKIKDIFPTNNQIAIIYKNKDDNYISEYCKSLEDKDYVNEVLCYGNTINEKLKYNELMNKLNDLGSNISIEDYLFKILYYNYYNQDETNKITISEFISFIQNNVYNNEIISSKIDNLTKENLEKLNNFTDIDSINKQRNSNEISNILEINKESIDDIFIYYGSKNNDTKITLDEFAKFMNNKVLTNEKYSNNIDSNMKNNIKALSKFTDINLISSKMTSTEMNQLFGIDKDMMDQLYIYYISTNEINNKMTISEFSNFVTDYVLTNNNYKNSIDDTSKKNIEVLKNFSNKDIILKEMNSNELSKLFNIDESLIKQLLLLKYSKINDDTKMTLNEFITTISYIKTNTNYLDNIDVSSLILLSNNADIMNNPNTYTALEISSILGIEENKVYNLYAIINFSKDNISNWVSTPNEFINLILTNKDNINMDSSLIDNLNFLSNIISSTLNNNIYTYQELSEFISIDQNTIKNIYALYISCNSSIKLTPQEFVNFILNHKNDSILNNNLSLEIINELSLLNSIMNGRVNQIKYSSLELSNLIGISQNNLNLIYSLYDFEYNNKTMSLKDFTNFLLTDVITNDEYANNFNQNIKSKLNTINEIMNSTINSTKYYKGEMFDIISNLTNDLDKNMIDLLYIYYGSENNYDNNWTLTVEEFVNFLNNNILKDERFDSFLENSRKQEIISAKKDIQNAKNLLVGNNYSRIVINTDLNSESDTTFKFIQNIKDNLKNSIKDFYVIGDSPMAYEISQTFGGELDFITILTMISIFIVVAITFKSIIIPIILVFMIQCAVYMTMGILSFTGGTVYFIALLIVQSILMGATIDYAILYTTYYIEHRKTMNIKDAIINSYNKSIHTILTSASILIIVTLIVGLFASAIASKICKTLSQGTLCSALLILLLLPAVLAACDKLIIKKNIK